LIRARACPDASVWNNVQLEIVGCCSSQISPIANHQNEPIRPEQDREATFVDGIAHSSNRGVERTDFQGRRRSEQIHHSSLLWLAHGVLLSLLCGSRADVGPILSSSLGTSRPYICMRMVYGKSPSLKGSGVSAFQERIYIAEVGTRCPILKSVACRAPKCWLHQSWVQGFSEGL